MYMADIWYLYRKQSTIINVYQLNDGVSIFDTLIISQFNFLLH